MKSGIGEGTAMGASIFADAIGGILTRPMEALRVSLVPAALAILAWALLVGDAPRIVWTSAGPTAWSGGAPAPLSVEEATATTLRLLAFGLVAAAAAAWVGAGWHRVVLRRDRPGWTPPVPLSRLGAYFWVAVRLFAVLLGFGALLLLVSVAFLGEGGLPGLAGRAADYVVVLLATYVSLRFGLALPAAAIGRPMTLGESWDLTGAAWPSVLGISTLLAGASLILGLAQQAMPGPGWAALGMGMVGGWMASMLGIGALTALYARLLGPLDG